LFNVSNALAATSVALQEGIWPAIISGALARFAGVPGRMERIDCGQPFELIVDYAHTGDALHKVLETLRTPSVRRIIAVFGSAGERGHSRRSGMAASAASLADFTVLTDEDPRSEDPLAIIEEMAAGLRAAGRREPEDFLCVPDREEAIREAVRYAQPGDVVLLAGKGHEQSIEIAGRKLPWDDREAARRALAVLGHIATP
jgi:UDP-N-acetylmuramoyl-L-alanyl-D-glutamate--2,6-diaminopimelate ligase